MRRIPLLIATLWTLTYWTAAQAAIVADLAATAARAKQHAAPPEPGAIWNGGTLAPITVYAGAPTAPAAAPVRWALPVSRSL
jgi:hypothetical protein